MQHKLLKTMLLALLVWAAVPTLTAQVAHVGDILCEGNAIISPANYPSSGATAIGVVFYVDNTGQHGWAIALEDAGSYAWGCWNSDTPLVNYTYGNQRQAFYDFNGYENTRIVREHNPGHPAFYAVDFENGWYVPAIGQLNYFYGNLMEINAGLEASGGIKINCGDNWNYWSSTECSSYTSWYLVSSGEISGGNSWLANPGLDDKSIIRRVRAARNF